MKNLIKISFAFLILFAGCKKQKEADKITSNTVQSCSPLPDLEGAWFSDSCRFICILNGATIQDTTTIYNGHDTTGFYMNLIFKCEQNTPMMYGETDNATFDGNKYTVSNNEIHIIYDYDPSLFDIWNIYSLNSNHLVLKFYDIQNDTVNRYTLRSLRK